MTQDCPLYGTEECRLLNMKTCETCPVSEGERVADITERIDIYRRDTEGADIPAQFSGEECKLCRREPKQKVGYIIYDLGHTLPEGKEEPGWRKLLKGGGPSFDILLPLQFNCCASCRKHLWWNNNLVTVTTLGLFLLTLIPVSIELSAEKFRAVSRFLPLLTLIGSALVGFIAGKLIKKKLSAKWAEETVMELREHPVCKRLFEQGWQPALVNSSKKETVMFTKKLLDCGLGTAPAKQAEEQPAAGTPSETPSETLPETAEETVEENNN